MEIRLRFTFLEFSDERDTQPSAVRSSSLPPSFAPRTSHKTRSSSFRQDTDGEQVQRQLDNNTSGSLPSDSDWLPRDFTCAGSAGHPHLCSRPCVYMLKAGHCSGGVGCGFCHLPHQQLREQKLAKKARALLQAMPKPDFIKMMWSLIREKLLCAGQEVIWTVHGILEEEMHHHETSTPEGDLRVFSQSQIWKLQQEIQRTRMNLASLLAFIARRCHGRNQGRLRDMLTDMRQRAGDI
ncbi:CIT1 [Symbiodinium pilosum]|uniref:CIT1 protein n=1 Tax=Symbiodinium pilosum TaxID=2952 RepID=A0A812RXN2_SYMPI|nr:CIT1 [Symbiodinium pilosum]